METRRILMRVYVLRVVYCYYYYFCSLRLVLFVSLVNVIILKLGTAKLQNDDSYRRTQFA